MKKWLLVSAFLVILVFVTGCSGRLNLEVPDTPVLIEKNIVPWDEDGSEQAFCFGGPSLQTVVEDPVEIAALFAALNRLRVREEILSNTRIETCGFRYVITWDEGTINSGGSARNRHFINVNHTQYILTKGDFSFLDDYEYGQGEE